MAKENIKIHKTFPFPIQKAKELENYCNETKLKISEIVLENEKLRNLIDENVSSKCKPRYGF